MEVFINRIGDDIFLLLLRIIMRFSFFSVKELNFEPRSNSACCFSKRHWPSLCLLRYLITVK